MKSTIMTEKQLKKDVDKAAEDINNFMNTLKIRKDIGILALLVVSLNAMADTEEEAIRVCSLRLCDIMKSIKYAATTPDPELN